MTKPLIAVVSALCIAASAVADSNPLFKFDLFGKEKLAWINGTGTYREYLDVRLQFQRAKIDSVRLIIRTGRPEDSCKSFSIVRNYDVGSVYIGATWKEWQDVDTLGALHDQWVWGKISYREYLNLRLGRPRFDWLDFADTSGIRRVE